MAAKESDPRPDASGTAGQKPVTPQDCSTGTPASQGTPTSKLPGDAKGGKDTKTDQVPPGGTQKPGGERKWQNLTDAGNSRLFVGFAKNKHRYCPNLGWLTWDTPRWREVHVEEILQTARLVPKRLFRDARKTDGEAGDAIRWWAKTSESRGKLEAIVALARSEPEILTRFEDFDVETHVLNTDAGPLDLRTGKLNRCTPENLFTMVAPVDLDPDAKAPRWEQFLKEVFKDDADLIAFVQRAVGYSLTGDTSEQVFFLLHGSGANGKGVFVHTIEALLGDYAKSAEFRTFMSHKQGGVRNDIARLAGARFVSACESGEGACFDEAIIKQLTGGDRIAARFLYKEHFEFTPAFKVWLATNHKPQIRGTDYAIWRRVMLIPFEATFPPDKQDRHLEKKLKAELPGILNWALQGFRKWQAEGLSPPKTVQQANDVYREECDVLGSFIDECCEQEERAKAGATALYERYAEYCKENREPPIRQREFGKRLGERGYEKRRSGPGGRFEWHGIRVVLCPSPAGGDEAPGS